MIFNYVYSKTVKIQEYFINFSIKRSNITKCIIIFCLVKFKSNGSNYCHIFFTKLRNLQKYRNLMYSYV